MHMQEDEPSEVWTGYDAERSEDRSEVGLGGRGPEAGHGLGGRVDERRKPLDSEKHREPEGDHGRKVMEAAAARSSPMPLPTASPNFLTWY